MLMFLLKFLEFKTFNYYSKISNYTSRDAWTTDISDAVVDWPGSPTSYTKLIDLLKRIHALHTAAQYKYPAI